MKGINFLKLVILGFSMIISSQGMAQNAEDALRYSRSYYPSNARSAGVANAFGALGANEISPSINPAGLGLFRKSRFSISPSFENFNTESNYLGTSSQDQTFNFNIGNLSLVFTDIQYKMGEPKTDGWASVSFAMGFNRKRSLHKRSFATGLNTKNSILDAFADQAQGTYPYQFTTNTPEGLAYRNWLINPFFPDSSNYYSAIDPGNHRIQQERSVQSSGGTNDIYLSLGGNYSNQLYIGGTIGIPTVSYEQETTFSETNQGLNQANLNDSVPNFRSMQFTESFSTSGAGIYAGLGFIYRPTSSLRFGASIFSPEYYSLEDEYEYSIQAEVEDTPDRFSGQESSPSGNFEYNLTTPFRVTASMAYIFSDLGFLSVDYEMKNPSSARLSADEFRFASENNIISNIYQPIHNVRVGTEWNYDVFAFRAGYGYYSSPFKDTYVSGDADGSTNLYSIGLGLQQNEYSIDLAYRMTFTSNHITPYQVSNPNNDPEIKEDVRHSNLLLTFTYQW